jgi:hypothetical protein
MEPLTMAEFLNGTWPVTIYAIVLTALCGYEFFGKPGASATGGRIFLAAVSFLSLSFIAGHFLR